MKAINFNSAAFPAFQGVKSVVAATAFAIFTAGAGSVYHLAGEVPASGRAIVNAMKADEGLPQNLVTAMKADEGVPQNLVTAMKADEGVPQNLIAVLPASEGTHFMLRVALAADEGVPSNLVTDKG